MAKKKAGNGNDEPTFEAAMGELEAIVRRLEQGGGSLESALEDYSSAISLMKVCHQKLEVAERRVEILSGFDAKGNPISEAVEDLEDEDLEEKREARSARRSAADPNDPDSNRRTSAKKKPTVKKKKGSGGADSGLF